DPHGREGQHLYRGQGHFGLSSRWQAADDDPDAGNAGQLRVRRCGFPDAVHHGADVAISRTAGCEGLGTVLITPQWGGPPGPRPTPSSAWWEFVLSRDRRDQGVRPTKAAPMADDRRYPPRPILGVGAII